MAGLQEEFDAKIGGVPVWAIGGGAVLVAAGFYEWRKRKQNQSPPPSSGSPMAEGGQIDPNAVDPTTGLTYAQEADPTQQPFPTGPIDSWLAQNPTSAGYPVGLTGQGLPGPVTNEQWARLAADELFLKGGVPTEVENALSDFLNGHPLSAVEQGIINIALQTFGSPPEGLIPVQTGGNTPPPPNTDQSGLPFPATQPTVSHTVTAGETMRQIVTDWTRANNGGKEPGAQQIADNLRTVYVFNSYLKGREVKPGDVIVLPKFARGYY
jgi:hypothetical protein